MDIILILALIAIVVIQGLLGLELDRLRKHMITLTDCNIRALDADISRRAQHIYDELEKR